VYPQDILWHSAFRPGLGPASSASPYSREGGCGGDSAAACRRRCCVWRRCWSRTATRLHMPRIRAPLPVRSSRCSKSATHLLSRNRIILQNHRAYNTRRSRYLPPRFPLGLRTVALRLTILSPSSEGSYGPEYNPLRPLSCLLLKPISAHYAYCPIGSTCRPTRASVLSGHIDSVTVTAIICHAPQQEALHVPKIATAYF
jgi:hypothetical protein